MLHQNLTSYVIGCFYTVYNALGYGFLESVYERALKIELERNGTLVERQSKIEVFYGHDLVGEFYADLLVNNSVIIELKATERLHPQHEAQLLNYLKATSVEVGLLLNFGEHPQIIRRIYSNDRKKAGRQTQTT
ncbi:MAG: GxxExxY protein [Candidatus Kapaibacterium sp.]